MSKTAKNYMIEVEDMAKELCEKVGYKFVSYKFKSSHPEDLYLFLVMGRKEDNFAVWTLNTIFESLSSGCYSLTFEEAMENMQERSSNAGYKYVD